MDTSGEPRTLDEAQPGDGATYTSYTDSQAGTIIARTRHTITWRRDKAVLLNGVGSGESDALQFSPGGFFGHTSGVQRYRYERDPQGQVLKFSRRRLQGDRTVWKLVGHRTRSPGCALSPGRNEHYDFNF